MPSPQPLDTRSALVTGANRGLGLAIAEGLARLGWRVWLGARDAAKGAEAAAYLRTHNLSAEPLTLDVSQESSIVAACARLTDEGGADALINNAGVFLDSGVRALDVDMAVVRRTLEINTFGALRLAQLLAPGLVARGWGRIVNVSSEMGARTWDRAEDVAYRMSKAALLTMTSALAYELKGTGVLVNAMHPGWVRTEMGGKHATRSPQQAADTAIWLATLPDDGPTGGFWFDRAPYQP
jgi:NAD(P)-dependent dehydrogenase (short-subunit alcohol dehydrogenase family)